MTPDPLDLDAVEADARLYARTFNAEFPTTGGSTDSLAVASFDALMVSHTALVTRLRAAEAECARLRDVDALAGRFVQTMWDNYSEMVAYERGQLAKEYVSAALLADAKVTAQAWVDAARTAGA